MSLDEQVNALISLADTISNAQQQPPNSTTFKHEHLQILRSAIPQLRQAIQNNILSIAQLADSRKLGLDRLITILMLIDFSDSDEEQVGEDLCSLVEMYLDDVDFSDLMAAYGQVLLDGLQSSSPRIRILCISQCMKPLVADMESNHNWRLFLLENARLFVDCLANGDLRVFKGSKEFLVRVSRVDVGVLCDARFVAAVGALFDDPASQSSVNGVPPPVIRTRIIETLCMCCQSHEFVKTFGHIFNHLNKWISTDTDPLIQCVALELLGELVQTEYGYSHVYSTGVLTQKITDIISHTFDDPESMNAILFMAQCVQFLGRLGLSNPKKLFELDDKFQFLRQIIRLLTNYDDFQLMEASVTAIGQIASSELGILALHSKYPEVWSGFTRNFRPNHSAGNQSLYQAYLRAIAAILASAKSAESIQLVENQILNRIGAEILLQSASKSAQHSFPDFKNAGYACLRGMASLVVGCKHMMNDNVLMSQFFLNRTAESTHEGQVAKYNLIKQVVETCSESQNSFTAHQQTQLHRLQEYVRQGVYYAEGEAAVAMGQSGS